MTTTISSTNTGTNRTNTTERKLGSETKASFKTTELLVLVASVVGVLVASQLVGSDSGSGDIFRADRAWTLITALAIGYMVSRGLAKSGSRDISVDSHS